ncbi:MAG: histidine phosphatase family protein [Acidimicrobiaceae bacterium]|nr:histidine phosphatase family protein [Acidimicrobiaceae bacterium]
MAIAARYRLLGLPVAFAAWVVSLFLSHRASTVGSIMLNVLIARHGQSEWNQLGRWQGQADPQLSEFGFVQASDAATNCGSFDAIISSNLQRASQTAAVISEATGIGPVLIDDAFSERDVGLYQGLTREEIDERFPGQLDAGVWPEGWETDETVLQRVLGGLESLRRQCGDGDVLVVAHGGVIYALERHFGHEYHRIPNLEGRWLHHDGTSWHLGERVALTQKLEPQKQDLIL